MSTELTIPTRFRGPARSGNGGWTAGALAALVPGDPRTVEVTLRQPPPLEVAMDVRTADGETVLSFGGSAIAQARVVETELVPVEGVDVGTAEQAMAGYAGLRRHPFPECFACGTDRASGDGLRIFPGPVGADTVASLWVPDEATVPVTWAALDCVGGWSEDLEGRPMVLGRMTCSVDALPEVGETHVVVGRRLRAEGRKTFTASTLYDGDGRVVATAAHVWVQVDPSLFN